MSWTLCSILGLTLFCSLVHSPDPPSPQRISYGTDPSQFGELTRPSGQSCGVVAIIHGGFWLSGFTLELGRSLAQDLVGRGYTTWNIEYRPVGGGGGVPQTLDDVAVAFNILATVDGLELSRVLALGHSAGGQLAAWAVARGRFDRWRSVQVRPFAVISQAGVLDLRAAAAEGLGNNAVQAFLGGQPDDERVDPTQQIPIDVPVVCVHGDRDANVPANQSTQYVVRAQAAGENARLVRVPGDHFALINTTTEAWRTTVQEINKLFSPSCRCPH